MQNLVQNILPKLQLKKRDQLIRYALQRGLGRTPTNPKRSDARERYARVSPARPAFGVFCLGVPKDPP